MSVWIFGADMLRHVCVYGVRICQRTEPPRYAGQIAPSFGMVKTLPKASGRKTYDSQGVAGLKPPPGRDQTKDTAKQQHHGRGGCGNDIKVRVGNEQADL